MILSLEQRFFVITQSGDEDLFLVDLSVPQGNTGNGYVVQKTDLCFMASNRGPGSVVIHFYDSDDGLNFSSLVSATIVDGGSLPVIVSTSKRFLKCTGNGLQARFDMFAIGDSKSFGNEAFADFTQLLDIVSRSIVNYSIGGTAKQSRVLNYGVGSTVVQLRLINTEAHS